MPVGLQYLWTGLWGMTIVPSLSPFVTYDIETFSSDAVLFRSPCMLLKLIIILSAFLSVQVFVFLRS